MIDATEAQALFAQPPFTAIEVEDQIRRTAAHRGWTCFDKNKFTEELRSQLEANGFKVDPSGTDYIVSWEKESADKVA